MCPGKSKRGCNDNSTSTSRELVPWNVKIDCNDYSPSTPSSQALVPWNRNHLLKRLLKLFDCSNFFLQKLSIEHPSSFHLSTNREVHHVDFISGDRIFVHNDNSSFGFESNLIFLNHALRNLGVTDSALFVDHVVISRSLNRIDQVLLVDHCCVFILSLNCGSFVLHAELIFSFDSGGLNSCLRLELEMRLWFHSSCIIWRSIVTLN